MKKMFIYILLLHLFLLSSCLLETRDLGSENLNEKAVNAYIVDVTNYTYEYDIKSEIKDLDKFLNEFSKITYKSLFGDPEGCEGLCIMLVYENNNYEIFDKNYIVEMDSEDNVVNWYNFYVVEDEYYEKLLSKYYQIN